MGRGININIRFAMASRIKAATVLLTDRLIVEIGVYTVLKEKPDLLSLIECL